MAYPEINTILRQTVNEVTTIHNSAPTIQTIISKDSPTITTIVNGFWDAVWSVNGQTGDVRIEFTFDPFKPNTVYLQNQAIVHNDNIYIARESFTSGNTFNEADWNIIGDMANADMVTYNNTETGISATTVQDALDYVIGQVPTDFFKLSTTTISGEGNAITLANTAEVPFKNVVLKGDTFQQSYEGKNLLPMRNTTRTINGVTFTPQADGSVVLSGTSTAQINYPINVDSISLSRNVSLGAGTYTVSWGSNPQSSGMFVQVYYIPDGGGDTYSTGTFTVSGTTALGAYIRVNNGINTTGTTIYPQLELGSTATSYEPYVGGTPAPNPDYPQDINVVTGEQTVTVTGKNLWASSWEQGNIRADTGEDEPNPDVVRCKDFVPVKAGVSYAINRSISTSFVAVRCYDADKQYLGSGTNNIRYISGDTGGTATNPMIAGGSYCVISPKDGVAYIKFIDRSNNLATQYMMVEGDTQAAYEPYQGQSYPLSLGSLELCKIGDYQDVIFKNTPNSPLYDNTLVEGGWYINKKVGKQVFTGADSEVWRLSGVSARLFNITIAEAKAGASSPMMSDRFIYTGNSSEASQENVLYTNTLNAFVFINPKSEGELIANTISEWCAWLSTHNTTVYYALATATDTQITDATLIAQLEDLRSAYSYEEQTNISVSAIDPNLPFILSVDAFLNTTWEGFQSGVGKLAENVQQDTLKKWDVRDNISDGDDHLVTGGGVYDALREIDNNSAAAHNSIVRGKDLTNIYTLDELSAKVQAGDFSDIYVGDYITKKVTVGSGTERELDFVIAHIDYFMHVGDTETTRHHLVMVPDTAFYEYMQMNDTNTTTGGYYGSKGHGICNAVYSAGTGGALTSVVADYTTFQATTLGAAEGTFVFTHTSGGWQYDGTVVSTGNLSAYGITYSGTPVDGDVITVSYVPGYLEPYRQAIYTAFGNDHILAHRTQYSTSTSTSAWHTNRCELMNESMVYGQIVRANNVCGELTENSQLAWFSARPDKRIAMRGKGSTSRAGAWLSSISSGSTFCFVSTYGNAANYNASSSIAVRPYFLFA